MPAWPAVSDTGSALFELTDASSAPAGRLAVQKVVGGASAVLVCLVDGENREWCLDEGTARRWIEGAGGGAVAGAGAPKLPIPVQPDNPRGRLLLVASAQVIATMNLPLQQVRGFDWSVAHLGKLIPAGAAGRAAELAVAPGDVLSGSVSLLVAAEAIARVLGGRVPTARNSSFAVQASGGDQAIATEIWDDQFLKLVGPELVRLPLKAGADSKALLWLREFALSFKKAGNTLPTPIDVIPMDDGAKIVFLKSGFELKRGYDDDDKVGGGKQDAGSAGGAPDLGAREIERAAALRGRPDGGLRLILEDGVVDGGIISIREGAVVKEMSESAILRRLRKELPGQA
ncbi:hypothetical protein T492DRAFT_921716 [Pavlovales sp. CCMP2436]|nr:hypothetical protein T492DRAFT_921716 [Pavlovales sp. CCMP2436]